jgi:hypothetical protein
VGTRQAVARQGSGPDERSAVYAVGGGKEGSASTASLPTHTTLKPVAVWRWTCVSELTHVHMTDHPTSTNATNVTAQHSGGGGAASGGRQRLSGGSSSGRGTGGGRSDRLDRTACGCSCVELGCVHRCRRVRCSQLRGPPISAQQRGSLSAHKRVHGPLAEGGGTPNTQASKGRTTDPPLQAATVPPPAQPAFALPCRANPERTGQRSNAVQSNCAKKALLSAPMTARKDDSFEGAPPKAPRRTLPFVCPPAWTVRNNVCIRV